MKDEIKAGVLSVAIGLAILIGALCPPGPFGGDGLHESGYSAQHDLTKSAKGPRVHMSGVVGALGAVSPG
ncbi:hypothetical protein SAMN05421688_2810 [Poseidonocella pacifica]|uniref:Uncharacterized protein n=1 Tax=Poseidonocella pacifica TaxID=871651 RepID=A0A1I0Y486_9RHOB|nr:hypothetical protein [Poseidonocella pacifica]SFB08159.1 hypothetical protein SAMN05421688_2810 [Poseidonocella pacifica]